MKSPKYPKFHIQNESPHGKAFKVFGGTHVVKRGATEVVPVEDGLTDEQMFKHRQSNVFILPVELLETHDPRTGEPIIESEPVKDPGANADQTRAHMLTKAAELEIEKAEELNDEALAAAIKQAEADAAKRAEEEKAALAEREELLKRAEPLQIADTDAMNNETLKAAVEQAETDAAKADAEAAEKAKADEAAAAEKAKADAAKAKGNGNTGGGK
ncbi:MAG: hypothetical protein ABJL57_11760 [Hyphomonas sp.]|uniref:hypothetical protein n=1 Tax=Hyphomonas sp. TaxID=87 RepID=UPI003265ABBC